MNGTRVNSADLPSALRQAGWLLLGAALAAALIWLLSADRLPLAASPDFYEQDLAAAPVTIPDALVHYDTGDHLFVDTRTSAETGGVIPGSFVVRAETFSADLVEISDFLSPADPLILYGDGNLQPVSDVAALFQERGYEDLLILGGGLRAWREAGGPLVQVDPEDDGDE